MIDRQNGDVVRHLRRVARNGDLGFQLGLESSKA